MAQPLLLCMGATKAGTSWLYRALHDHPDCSLPAVKELHYWDTFEADARERQLAAYRERLAEIEAGLAEAAAAGREAQLQNRTRRREHMVALLEMLAGDRSGDRLYRDYLARVAGGRLTADLTPSYGLLEPAALARLVAALPEAKFVYLVRDPLDRLWSHVRMQADRQRRPDEAVETKANQILRRIVERGHEGHITQRGDYASAAGRLRSAIPADRLRIATVESVTGAAGWADLCGWLGIAPTPAEGDRRVHEGPKVAMLPELEAPALALLRDQYDWAARELGALPASWRSDRARVEA